MTYESTITMESTELPGVRYTVRKLSFDRRLELLQSIRDIASRMEFERAGRGVADQAAAAVSEGEIDRCLFLSGVASIEGLEIEGSAASPESLLAQGPTALVEEILRAVRDQTFLSKAERKN